MTQPYYIADRRERDMVDWHEPDSVEVREHESPAERLGFWLAWGAAGGDCAQRARIPTGEGR